MTPIRIAIYGGLAALAALAFALPATAHRNAAHATVVTVVAGKPSEFAFKLSTKKVKLGTVTFKVTDQGALAHDFKVCSSNKGTLKSNACAGKGTAAISPKGSAKLTIKFTKKGIYEYLCTLPGHAAAGQKGLLTVS
jgi:uncharacterized cupredoxin-like copper-binding protein